MAEAVRLRLKAEGGMWVLSRDGQALHRFSHAERGLQEAVALARAIEDTGQPAEVAIEDAEGRAIDIVTVSGSTETPVGGDRSAIDPGR